MAKAALIALLAALWADPVAVEAWVASALVELLWPVTACITSARLSEPSLLVSSWEIRPPATWEALGGALWEASRADNRSGANWLDGVDGVAAVVADAAEFAELDWASPAESVLKGVPEPTDANRLVSICWSHWGRGVEANPLIFMEVS